jgi:protein transport protein SEC13
VRIFDVREDGSRVQTGECTGHEGAVWQTAWAHPQFGALLATCGYDKRVMVFREMAQSAGAAAGGWVRVFVYEGNASSGAFLGLRAAGRERGRARRVAGAACRGVSRGSSLSHPYRPHSHTPVPAVNSVAWAPAEFGLHLATASSDGKVTILSHREDNSWGAVTLDACPIGCTSVSWAPFSAASPGDAALAAGGCDGATYLWRAVVGAGTAAWERPDAWARSAMPRPAADAGSASAWVRDVAWCPAGVALATGAAAEALVLASCTDDGRVLISRPPADGDWARGEWTHRELPRFHAAVWRVSWSVTGRLLAVASADNSVTVWKEDLTGSTWQQVTSVPAA